MAEIAVIVPTINRARLLPGLIDSIHIHTKHAYIIYIVVESCDPESLTTLEGRDCVPLVGDYGSYTVAANAGVDWTTEPYFIVANDDVLFGPGWDEAALAHMHDPIRVVGINQGNGRTDCFFLVDRRYLSEQSGVIDEPGRFYHDGYWSQFCDTEFCEVAKARGVWADAPDALIEHRHWTLGKSDMDENYQVAVASVPHDQDLYESRRGMWAGSSM
jgi:glycosyltransferase involved in cell wall biosynthesis